MTSFGDVNVGDKVRLTAENGDVSEFRVTKVVPAEGGLSCWLWSKQTGHSSRNWPSVEVLEPAPKPLPDIPGIYISEIDTRRINSALRWHLGIDAEWSCDGSGEWKRVLLADVPRNLVRLVPSTAVEEARAEVVKEIVKELRESNFTAAALVVQHGFGGKS